MRPDGSVRFRVIRHLPLPIPLPHPARGGLRRLACRPPRSVPTGVVGKARARPPGYTATTAFVLYPPRLLPRPFSGSAPLRRRPSVGPDGAHEAGVAPFAEALGGAPRTPISRQRSRNCAAPHHGPSAGRPCAIRCHSEALEDGLGASAFVAERAAAPGVVERASLNKAHAAPDNTCAALPVGREGVRYGLQTCLARSRGTQVFDCGSLNRSKNHPRVSNSFRGNLGGAHSHFPLIRELSKGGSLPYSIVQTYMLRSMVILVPAAVSIQTRPWKTPDAPYSRFRCWLGIGHGAFPSAVPLGEYA
jgi:hypothetical protein